MGLVLPGSEDRVITPGHGVEARERMLALCPIPLAAAACPNRYGHHSEHDRKRLLPFKRTRMEECEDLSKNYTMQPWAIFK